MNGLILLAIICFAAFMIFAFYKQKNDCIKEGYTENQCKMVMDGNAKIIITEKDKK